VSEVPRPSRVRLDRWLWAARFFKSRSQAKDAIDGGRVRVDGDRAKPSREVAVGARLSVPRGLDVADIVVIALAERRGSAADAALLYAETDASLARREANAASRRLTGAAFIAPAARPSKRDRRALTRLKQGSRDHANDRP
jgi:ribosome-associated heat shock protein Hsp15